MTPANWYACSQKRFEIYGILIDRNPEACVRYGFAGAALNPDFGDTGNLGRCHKKIHPTPV